MLNLIRDLASTCRPSKLDKAHRSHAADLMKQLRGYGFTNHELSVLARRMVSEPTIKRWTRGVTVEDTTEHDKIIAILGDFALGGNTIKDIDEYKVDRKEISGILSFKDCVKLAGNLVAIGANITGLLKLGDELAGLDLKVPAINANIALNKELGDLGVTPQIQAELLEASRRFGDHQEVFKALEIYDDIKALENIKKRLENIVEILEKREADSKRRKEGYDNEALRQKTYLDIVKLLVSDYSYDYDSLRTLHDLAAKYGNPLHVMGAVNAYAGIEQMKVSASAVEVKLKNKGSGSSRRDPTGGAEQTKRGRGSETWRDQGSSRGELQAADGLRSSHEPKEVLTGDPVRIHLRGCN